MLEVMLYDLTVLSILDFWVTWNLHSFVQFILTVTACSNRILQKWKFSGPKAF